MELNIPALDLTIEEEGKWFTYRDSIQFKIARMNNDAFLAGAAAMYAALDSDLKDSTEEQKGTFMITLYARYILKDWKGVINVADDETVDYTYETGIALLSETKYKDALSFILEKARAISEYWEERTVEVGEE